MAELISDLYINIHEPRSATPQSGLSVIVFIGSVLLGRRIVRVVIPHRAKKAHG